MHQLCSYCKNPRFWCVWPAIAACVVVAPMLIWGYPWGGHDFPFHCYSWLDAVSQFRQGNLFPHWAARANYGFGDPRFIFYPPVSWTLGGLLSLALPWKLVPGLFVWIGVMGAGCSMYLLASRWLPSRWAIVAALAYMTNPYELMVVYWRAAQAELLAAALFPLLLLFALRMADDERQAFLPFAAVFAAIWLTNAPAAVISSYAIALVLLLLAIRHSRVRIAWVGAAALALGLCLAAFYILPAMREQAWVQIAMALNPDVSPQHNFVVLHPPRNGRFIATAGVNAALGMLLALIAILRRKDMPRFWPALVVLCGIAAFLMFPVSAPAWRYVPELRFVQLPWRWLFVLNAVSALLLGLICSRLRRRTQIAVVSFVFVLFCVMLGVARIKHGRPGEAERLASEVALHGYWGAPEYLPKGTARPQGSGQPLFVPSDGAQAASLPNFRRSEQILIRTSFAVPGELRVPVLWYPAWRVEVDGLSVPALNRDGWLAVRVAPGPHTVVMRFGQTGDRRLGAAISLIALLICVFILAMSRRRPKAPSQTERADVLTCAGV